MSAQLIESVVLFGVVGGLIYAWRNRHSPGTALGDANLKMDAHDDFVDVRRGRHDGTQPTEERAGNNPLMAEWLIG